MEGGQRGSRVIDSKGEEQLKGKTGEAPQIGL